ncbi:ATP-binding protein [Streptomyces sp. NPDC002851]
MSLPLTRRIARAALLGAAGAASVVGAAGSASAVNVPATPDLGGLSQLDGAGLGNTVDQAAQGLSGQATDTGSQATDTGSKAVKKAVPAAGKAVDKAGKRATPAAQKATGTATKAAGDTAGSTKGGLQTEGLPTDSLTSGVSSGLPASGIGPVGGALPLG